MTAPQMDVARMSPPQKRMLLQSVMGRRSQLHCKVTGKVVVHDVEVIAVSVDLMTDPDKAAGLIVRMYGEDNRWATIPMTAVTGVTPLPWYDNDPRHPDYAPEAQVVTALPVRGRR